MAVPGARKRLRLADVDLDAGVNRGVLAGLRQEGNEEVFVRWGKLPARELCVDNQTSIQRIRLELREVIAASGTKANGDPAIVSQVLMQPL